MKWMEEIATKEIRISSQLKTMLIKIVKKGSTRLKTKNQVIIVMSRMMKIVFYFRPHIKHP